MVMWLNLKVNNLVISLFLNERIGNSVISKYFVE